MNFGIREDESVISLQIRTGLQEYQNAKTTI